MPGITPGFLLVYRQNTLIESFDFNASILLMKNDIRNLEARASMSVSAKWKDIDDLVKRWARKFPQEYQDNMGWVKSDREDYLMKPTRELRKGILIHPRLMIYIQHFHPTFLDTNQDLKEFSKRFPAFVVDTGIMPTRS